MGRDSGGDHHPGWGTAEDQEAEVGFLNDYLTEWGQDYLLERTLNLKTTRSGVWILRRRLVAFSSNLITSCFGD